MKYSELCAVLSDRDKFQRNHIKKTWMMLAQFFAHLRKDIFRAITVQNAGIGLRNDMFQEAIPKSSIGLNLDVGREGEVLKSFQAPNGKNGTTQTGRPKLPALSGGRFFCTYSFISERTQTRHKCQKKPLSNKNHQEARSEIRSA